MERSNYYKLSRLWSDRYRIYHNLPYLNVFPVKVSDTLYNLSEFPPQPFNITDLERNRLKKTSIDFTFCNEDDTPLVCIEFDGLQDGYNFGAQYHSSAEDYRTSGNEPAWREQIMGLKLRVAHGSFFPFFVVGSQHFRDVSPGIKLTIVDGIIGEVLAQRATRDRFSKAVNYEDLGLSEKDFEHFLPDEQHELIQNWVLEVEITNDFQHNPIYQEVEKISKHTGFYSRSIHFLGSPPNSAHLLGAEVVLHTEEFGDIRRTAWLPNFRAPYFSGLSLVEEIANLLAYDALLRLQQQAKS
jgi:hypothetical protein